MPYLQPKNLQYFLASPKWFWTKHTYISGDLREGQAYGTTFVHLNFFCKRECLLFLIHIPLSLWKYHNVCVWISLDLWGHMETRVWLMFLFSIGTHEQKKVALWLKDFLDLLSTHVVLKFKVFGSCWAVMHLTIVVVPTEVMGFFAWLLLSLVVMLALACEFNCLIASMNSCLSLSLDLVEDN